MYAFRKPFTVATFEGQSFFGIDYKILLIIAQVIGYTLSKFLGIKIISEMKSNKRMLYLIGFIMFAELALLGFAIISAPFNMVCLFLNGLPLGMIWGIVFSYLEGRKTTEILGVVLCSSFIVSSGVVKSVGKYVMDSLGFSELWMPFITGLLFIIPLTFFTILLEKLPPPTLTDQKSRTHRKPLNKAERFQLYKVFAFPLTLIIVFYVFVTGVRDFRDNFAREIWDTLGYKDSIGIYAFSEIPIAITVLLIMAFIGSVKNNYKAFKYYHIVLLLGGLVIGLSTTALQLQVINPVVWMILSGFGMYVCYIPFQGLFFDRMIATFKIESNVGFLIYIADAFGYLGSVLILLYKNFGKGSISYLSFFTYMVYVVAFIAIGLAVLSYTFFKNKYRNKLKINTLIYEQ
ncbi:hypothetical protein C1H87_18340 [Flavivirga eckloniae]|uniref:MFS transporter n=2 Tax=Flavivirga eckloniae TaxID=1803846 RepID=A0A2K9PXB5_9FLAO|nr:hypothetical protein C1H87_18340 [Flavivirga eckloniae]